MSLIAKRLVNIAASTALLSLVSAAANAQTDVLTGTTFNNTLGWGHGTSTYKFTGSMILNSIGFVTNGKTPESLSYTIKGTNYNVSVASLSNEENGFRWLTISPQSLVANDEVTVSTKFRNEISLPISYVRGNVTQPSPSKNVSYIRFDDLENENSYLDFTNSNLRVSNPGSNVAPEPGSFALALTGGAALIGICVRRRRNAG
jgi:hypothetical protein